MRTITLEEHYASRQFLEGPGGGSTTSLALADQLCDLDERRIAEMDEAGIDIQVVSLTAPGVQQLDSEQAIAISRQENDHLAAAVQRHPSRLQAFASLPTAAPAAAADELERAVGHLGFKGAMINGHSQGRYLDDQLFWPILERAEALQVPVYLHPTPPPAPVLQASYGGFSPEVTAILASGGWGWHIETALHVVRLILGGALDRFPRLQVVVGHLGEGLPFMLERLDMNLPREVTKLERSLGAYLRENVHYTFGGFNWLPPFMNLLLEVGAERIMFSADYPYRSMRWARTFLDELPVSPADRERIAHGNAERLLGV